MRKWKLITGVALVFILGILVGAVGTKMYLRYQHPIFKKDRGARKAFIMERLTRELNLRQDQRVHVEEIVNQLDEEARKRRRESRQEIRAMFDEGFNKIKEVLDPDQQKKLDEMKRELARKRKSRPRRK